MTRVGVARFIHAPDVLMEENRELVDHYGEMDDLRKERVHIGFGYKK